MNTPKIFRIESDLMHIEELMAYRLHCLKQQIAQMDEMKIKDWQHALCDKHDEIIEQLEPSPDDEKLNRMLFFMQLAMAKFEEIALPVIQKKLEDRKPKEQN